MRINNEEMAAHARRVAEEELAKMNLQPQAQLPAPAPAPAPPKPAPKLDLLPPADAGAAPTPAPAAQAPTPPAPPAQETPEQMLAKQRCQLVAGAIAMIQHEIGLRTRNYEWNYELWDNLPEDVLEKVCTAPDCITMFDAFRVEGINVAMLDEIKTKYSNDAKAVAWLKRGYGELVEWKKRFDLDPSFDPGAEEPEEPEDEPE